MGADPKSVDSLDTINRVEKNELRSDILKNKHNYSDGLKQTTETLKKYKQVHDVKCC